MPLLGWMFWCRLNTLSQGFTIFMALFVALPSASAFNPFSLSEELDKKLTEKQFLPTTEYYVASDWLKEGYFLVSKDLRSRLLELNFQEKSQNSLREGEFQQASPSECQEKLSLEIEPSSCFRIKDFQWGPQPAKASNQVDGLAGKQVSLLVAVQQVPTRPNADQVVRILNEETQNLVKAWPLKPLLLAQTVGSQPIMQKRTSLSDIPASCLHAVLAIEDTSFLEHSGVSLTGTLRAFVKNIVSGRKAQGGSTITQQLVKNYFLTPERTYKRKAQEIMISVLLETKYTKDQILETYLNIIYMAQNGPYQVLGFPAAAEYYFAKSIADLEPHECALLAAVLNGPGVYNPFRNPEKSLVRRNLVLDKMYEQKFLTERQFQTAKIQPLPSRVPAQASETSPYFLESARQQVEALGETLENKRILLTLDLEAQGQAQKALQNHLSFLEKENKVISKIKESQKKLLEGLFLSADADGRIIVAVGGRSFRQSQFNRITKSKRQIGSLVKPFVYLTAVENGAKPTDFIDDEKFEIKLPTKKTWSPENYDKKFLGKVPLYYALKTSLNSSTAKLGLDLGLDKIIDTLKASGVKSEISPLPSLTLGAIELPPLEVLQMYLTLSQMGQSPSLTFVEKVWDHQQRTLYERRDEKPEDYLSPSSAAITVGMMKQTLISGTAASAGAKGLQNYWAGKTGTTSDYKDTWFAGISPFESSLVWVGYDDNTPTKLTGASGAVPVWIDYTLWSQNRYQPQDFRWPDGVEEKVISSQSLIDSGFTLEKQSEIKLIFKKTLFGF